MSPTEAESFVEAFAELREMEVLSAVKARFHDNEDPLAIIEDCQQAMLEIGDRYRRGSILSPAWWWRESCFARWWKFFSRPSWSRWRGMNPA
jgi:methanogenic corrinoid protein MtbC1